VRRWNCRLRNMPVGKFDVIVCSPYTECFKPPTRSSYLHLPLLRKVMSQSSLSTIQVAYATASAGMHPSHTLPKKLKAIAAAGFTATEIAFPDLEDYAASENSDYKKLDDAGEGDLDALLAAAGNIRILLDELKLQALTIMPFVTPLIFSSPFFTSSHRFSEYEGYEDAKKQASNLNRARVWFKVMQVRFCTTGKLREADCSPDSGMRYSSSGVHRRRRHFLFL
jgi:hypothetical protein